MSGALLIFLKQSSDKEQPDQPSTGLVSREDDDKSPYNTGYTWCRRKDGVGCSGDVACKFIKYVQTPILAILFSHQQLLRGPHLRPVHASPLIALFVCEAGQYALDWAMGELLLPTLRLNGANRDQENSDEDQDDKPKRSLMTREADDKSPYNKGYALCRRKDGVGCLGDVACTFIEYVQVPVLLILFGEQQLLRGPHLRPAHAAVPLSLFMCDAFKSRIDNALGEFAIAQFFEDGRKLIGSKMVQMMIWIVGRSVVL